MDPLTVPPDFLADEAGALVACDWLQDRDTPLADVLVWYSRVDVPEGPATLLVGEYSGRATGDVGRAARVKAIAHPSRDDMLGVAQAALGRRLLTGEDWVGPECRAVAVFRRELRRRVLGLFPEVEIAVELLPREFLWRGDGFLLDGVFVPHAGVGSVRPTGGGPAFRVRLRAPDLVPPEPDYGLGPLAAAREAFDVGEIMRRAVMRQPPPIDPRILIHFRDL